MHLLSLFSLNLPFYEHKKRPSYKENMYSQLYFSCLHYNILLKIVPQNGTKHDRVYKSVTEINGHAKNFPNVPRTYIRTHSRAYARMYMCTYVPDKQTKQTDRQVDKTRHERVTVERGHREVTLSRQ